MKLSKHQLAIMEEMDYGALIGEFVGKFDSSYELFVTRKKTVLAIRRSTFFALLENGYIEPTDRNAGNHVIQITFNEPFSRDCWYRPTARAMNSV